TWTVGGEIFGYWATGSLVIPSTPSRMMMTDITVLRTGCVIKDLSIGFLFSVKAICIHRPGDHYRAIAQANTVENDLIAAFYACSSNDIFPVVGGRARDRHRDYL